MDTNIQSDDLRHRVQQLEMKMCGTSLDPSHVSGSGELHGSGRRSGLAHNSPHNGLAVLDRLDQLDKEVEGVTRVANKAKVEGCLCLICSPMLRLNECSLHDWAVG